MGLHSVIGAEVLGAWMAAQDAQAHYWHIDQKRWII
jgi:hypothetical protein